MLGTWSNICSTWFLDIRISRSVQPWYIGIIDEIQEQELMDLVKKLPVSATQ